MNLDLSTTTLKKVVRTAVQTFLGVVVAQWLSGDNNGITGLWDSVQANWDFAAGAALLAAIAAGGWNAVLDPSPIPSLNPDAPSE